MTAQSAEWSVVGQEWSVNSGQWSVDPKTRSIANSVYFLTTDHFLRIQVCL